MVSAFILSGVFLFLFQNCSESIKIADDDNEQGILVRSPGFPSDALAVIDLSVLDSDSIENRMAEIKVRLSRASNQDTIFNYMTEDGEAIAGVHYVATQGTAVIAIGELETTVLVPVLTSKPTGDVSFSLKIFAPSSVAVLKEKANFIIRGYSIGPILKNNYSTLTVSNSPQIRSGSSTALVGSEIFSFGGQLDYSTYSNDLYAFSTKTRTWRLVPTRGTAPSPRSHSTMVNTGSRLLVLGGSGGGNSTTSTTYGDLHSFDLSTGTWTKITAAGCPSVRLHKAVWTGSRMIILADKGDLYSFDPAANTWGRINATGSLPALAALRSVALAGSKLLVHGGNEASTDYFHEFDLSNNTWSKITASGGPSYRYGASAVWTGSEFILFGGGYADSNKKSIALSDVYSYNLKSNTWRKLAVSPSPEARTLGSAVWDGERMYILWGSATDGYMVETVATIE